MIIAIDLGGSHFDIVEVQENKIDLLYSHSIDKYFSFDEFVEVILNFFIKQRIFRISKLSFALPGIVDTLRNICIRCPNLEKWKNIDFSSIYNIAFEKGIEIEKILIGNDANCGTVGVLKYLRLQKDKNIVYIVIGTGIGGGAIINGKLLTGANFLAMEIGHTKIDKKSFLCGCGSYQCIETFASAKYLVDYYNKKHKTNYSGMLEIINSNYKVNDVFKRFSNYLALLVNNIIYLLDPDFIFISGKVVYSLDLFKKYFFRKLSSLITMIDNYDINRVVFLSNHSNNYNIFNLLGSVFMDKFI